MHLFGARPKAEHQLITELKGEKCHRCTVKLHTKNSQKILKINSSIFDSVVHKNCIQKTHKKSEKLNPQYLTQMYSKAAYKKLTKNQKNQKNQIRNI